MPRSDPQVSAFIQSLPDAYLKCRRLGHAWDDDTVDLVKGQYVVTVVCSRCDNVGVERLRRNGSVAKKRSSRYPSGYLAKGIGPVSRDLVRLESVMRKVDPTYQKDSQ